MCFVNIWGKYGIDIFMTGYSVWNTVEIVDLFTMFTMKSFRPSAWFQMCRSFYSFNIEWGV